MKKGGKKNATHHRKSTIGRKGCDIFLKDPGVSRMHDVIECDGEKIDLKDMDSSNSTLINRSFIQEDFLIDQEDIQLGETRLKFIRNP